MGSMILFSFLGHNIKTKNGHLITAAKKEHLKRQPISCECLSIETV